jgi:hypothetical protein
MTVNRLPTNQRLLTQAAQLSLESARNTVILWSGKQNQGLAKQFCEAHAGANYVTLEMILERHYGSFFRELRALPWHEAEEIWWLLSARLAEAATGAVRVFAAGIVNPELGASTEVDVSKHRSAHKPRGDARAAYCNSVFEKVEGPALDGNPNADPVLLMGRNINSKPSRY